MISIDTLHKPHEYDMINSHVIQIVPSMAQSLLSKLDTMGIKYDLLVLPENQQNPIVGLITTALQFTFIYVVAGFIISNLISRFQGGNRPGQGGGFGNPMRFLQSNTFDEITPDDVDVTFNDVAGCDLSLIHI